MPPPRRFTLEEAQSLLSRLAPLLWEMREKKQEHDTLRGRLDEARQAVRSNGHGVETQISSTQTAIREAATRVNEIVERVSKLGCELKDINLGLVDFRHVRDDGHEVYLCWKLGEADIEWWHELNTGFASRQPLNAGTDD